MLSRETDANAEPKLTPFCCLGSRAVGGQSSGGIDNWTGFRRRAWWLVVRDTCYRPRS